MIGLRKGMRGEVQASSFFWLHIAFEEALFLVVEGDLETNVGAWWLEHALGTQYPILHTNRTVDVVTSMR